MILLAKLEWRKTHPNQASSRRRSPLLSPCFRFKASEEKVIESDIDDDEEEDVVVDDDDEGIELAEKSSVNTQPTFEIEREGRKTSFGAMGLTV